MEIERGPWQIVEGWLNFDQIKNDPGNQIVLHRPDLLYDEIFSRGKVQYNSRHKFTLVYNILICKPGKYRLSRQPDTWVEIMGGNLWLDHHTWSIAVAQYLFCGGDK